MPRLEFGWWLLPLALTLLLSIWVYRGGIHNPQSRRIIQLMRAGGAIPLSLSLWLIWWLAGYEYEPPTFQ